MKTRNTEIGPLIGKALKERGWSQNHLAKLAGISASQIGRIINGSVCPCNKTIEKIAAVIGGSIDLPGEDFSDRLVKARWRKGMNQDTLADELGINVVSISNYETGKTMPSSFLLKCICEVLDVSADWLLGLKDYDVIITEKDS